MKINEAARLTGLTARAVRCYEEIGLIIPARRSRDREYTETDVRTLGAVAELRRSGISLEAIKRMISDPGSVRSVMKEQTALSRRELVEALRSAYTGPSELPELSLPDLDGMTQEEKTSALEGFKKKLAVKDYVTDRAARLRKRALRLSLGLVAVILAVCALSWVPRRVSFTLSGLTVSGDREWDDTLTVKGRLFTPLFFDPFFEGKVSLASRPEQTLSCDTWVEPGWGSSDWYHTSFPAHRRQGRLTVNSSRYLRESGYPYKFEITAGDWEGEEHFSYTLGFNEPCTRACFNIQKLYETSGLVTPDESSVYFASGAMERRQVLSKKPYY